MKDKNKGSGKVDEIRPNFWIKLLAILLLVFSLTVFSIKLMEYNDILRKQKEVEAKIQAYNENIEYLEYLLESPLDDEYVAKSARYELGLYFPNEIIFYNNYKK